MTELKKILLYTKNDLVMLRIFIVVVNIFTIFVTTTAVLLIDVNITFFVSFCKNLIELIQL